MMDGNNARFAVNTEGKENGGLVVSKAQGWDDNGNFYNPFSDDYTLVKPSGITSSTNLGTFTIGASAFKFLHQSQDYGMNRLSIRLNADGTQITFLDVSHNTSVALSMS